MSFGQPKEKTEASHHAVAAVRGSEFSLRKSYRTLGMMGESPPPPLSELTFWGGGGHQVEVRMKDDMDSK
jgi:hypothetical protein